MNDQHIIFSPERNQWTLTDGRHHMEVPEWARGIMRDEFERKTRPLRDSLDLALDSKRIAERRVTELLAENAKLRERITTQKQTIQAYRDESREWREVAERAQAENAKLRELVADMYMRFHGVVIENWAYSSEDFRMYEQRMRELGVEVDG